MNCELDFLDDTEFGLPNYYNFDNFQNLHNPLDDIEGSSLTFKMPNTVENGGKDFFNNLKNDKNTKPLTDVLKGTTTLGFVYKGGVIIAVDSRASMGTFMGSKTVRKVIEINDFLLGTMAGGAADCQHWLRRLNLWCKIYELRNGERVSISAAANYLCSMITQYKGYGLSMGTMVTGWDKQGPQLYYVDDDGKCLKGNIFSAGSGSTYAFGVLDSRYKFDMTEDQAAKLAYEAICHATYRDIGSGGYVRVYSVIEGGWKRLVDGDDVDEYHWKLARSKGLVGDGDETNNDKL
jgi:20S proteasome subunit beta 5